MHDTKEELKQQYKKSQQDLYIITLLHDLKTPLLAQISVIKKIYNENYGKLNTSQKEIISAVLESANFMKEMLASALFIYKYENNDIKLNKSLFNLNTLIQTCIKETYTLAQENRINIDYTVINENIKIFADEIYIRRVINNILNNAINYSYKESTMHIVLDEDKDNSIIKIKSSGNPIPDEIKQHIFEKYVSGENFNRRIGSGIGLYYCKMALIAHKGDIILNAQNSDIEFIIKIPKNKITEDYMVFM